MNLQLFHPRYEIDAVLASIRETLESGWTGTGPKCAALEREWSAYTNAKHSLYLNSATSALHLALKLCNLPKGARVITSPITFVSTNAVILYENLTPVFCDVRADTMSLQSADVKAAAGTDQDAQAVIWVHYGGSVSPDFYDFMSWRSACRGTLKVIEDCAHAAGARYKDGSLVGSRTDTFSCFSFQAVKNLPTADSGMLCTPTPAFDERARRLSWLGIDKSTYARSSDGADGVYKWRYDVPELGFKYNGNDVMAAIALAQLPYLDRDNDFRREIYRMYLHHFRGKALNHQSGSSHHLFVLNLANSKVRENAITALKAAGIAPGVHYLPNFQFPVFQPFYDGKQGRGGSCRTAEWAGDTLLSLPNHLRMTPDDVLRVARVVKEVL